MPGFRAGEKIEVRPGETRMEEIKELDRKVDPFIHVTPFSGEVASTLYDPGKNSALREFLEVGERGGIPEVNVRTKLEEYTASKSRFLLTDGSEEGLTELPRAEIHKPSLMEGILGVFRKIGGWFGGGLGGPMMIFGGLFLRPQEKLSFEEQVTEELGSKFHDSWRSEKKFREGRLNPVYQSTADESWIKANGGESKVDIASTAFSELPGDVKEKNYQYISAKIALGEVIKGEQAKASFDFQFIDSAAEVLFNGLLPHAKKPYGELPNFIKDGFQRKIKDAIQLYFQRKLEGLNNALRAWDEGKVEGDDGVFQLNQERSHLATENLRFSKLNLDQRDRTKTPE